MVSDVFDNLTLDRLREQADPSADAVVAAHFAEEARSAGELFAALVRHPDEVTASRAGVVQDFLDQRPGWPDWAEAALVRRGQQVFEQWGVQILPSLLLASLPEAYAAARGVQVLYLTARLATNPRRRVVETAQMTVDVMTVGGMDVGAAGYLVTRRVRLMHAAVRYLIAHDPFVTKTCDETVARRWCADWGVPINQEDLLGTLLTFTTVIVESLKRCGVRLSRADAEAYLHAWNVVGYFLGIDSDFLPLGLDQAYELQETIRRRQYAPSTAGHEMAMAVVDMASSEMRPRWLAGLPPTMIRYLVGPRVADLLGVPPSDWTGLLLTPARRLLAAVSLADQHDRLLRRIATHLGERLIVGFVDFERGGDRARFALPTHLADRWAIRAAVAPGPGPAAGSGTG